MIKELNEVSKLLEKDKFCLPKHSHWLQDLAWHKEYNNITSETYYFLKNSAEFFKIQFFGVRTYEEYKQIINAAIKYLEFEAFI